jgi:hypothetical protein
MKVTVYFVCLHNAVQCFRHLYMYLHVLGVLALLLLPALLPPPRRPFQPEKPGAECSNGVASAQNWTCCVFCVAWIVAWKVPASREHADMCSLVAPLRYYHTSVRVFTFLITSQLTRLISAVMGSFLHVCATNSVNAFWHNMKTRMRTEWKVKL